MDKNTIVDPTAQTYGAFESAYAHFNKELFDQQLPLCLITMQRRKHAYGYFSGDRFAKAGRPNEVTDEIAMNPTYFILPVRETLSTLVHEMAHLWQHHFGKPSRGRYHNKQWAAKMNEIGLIPSDTEKPGGKQTGQRMSHYIQEQGAFDVACAAWLALNPDTLYHDRASVHRSGLGVDPEKVSKIKAASKTRYTCPGCQANAWGKPDLHLLCGDCHQIMSPEHVDEAGLINV
jgi:predicted SprT family Zn-dependent metalloprotease